MLLLGWATGGEAHISISECDGSPARSQAAAQAGLHLDPSFTTERYRPFAASDDKKYLDIR
jgi:hypothetical protein